MLSIVAPQPLADAVVRGIAATLATSIFAEVANLIGVGLDDAVFLDHRHAHTVARVDDALELAATLVGTTAAAKQTTFVLRARHTSGEAWEPAIVLTGTAVAAEVTQDVVRSAARRRGGLAVVAAGAPGAPWCLCAADGRWTLEPLGVALVPVGLTVAEVEELHEVLRRADEPLLSGEGGDGAGADDADAPTPLPRSSSIPSPVTSATDRPIHRGRCSSACSDRSRWSIATAGRRRSSARRRSS